MKEIDATELHKSLQESGYAIIQNYLSDYLGDSLIHNFDKNELYRSSVDMERYRFGKGLYKYFTYPLPDDIQKMRERIYPLLVEVANNWMGHLGINKEFPTSHHELISLCHSKNQLRPTPLILKYQKGGYNTLHQDLYGEVFFPFQMVIVLSQPGVDFTGGEFVLVEQVPRAQSKAEVINLNKGDALIFTTNFKPVKGSKGYYKANIKHGVSTIRSGVRYALGIIFHDAI
ncbi:MAG: 2OG-Fe(II) oxygenase [Bacteroidetes bacterium]|nr:2OG-Fe(II) oxygenase [Bacteroidota bacterium]